MTAFYVLNATGDLFGEFEALDDARRGLASACADNPWHAHEFAILEFDENGDRVGDPMFQAQQEQA